MRRDKDDAQHTMIDVVVWGSLRCDFVTPLSFPTPALLNSAIAGPVQIAFGFRRTEVVVFSQYNGQRKEEGGYIKKSVRY